MRLRRPSHATVIAYLALFVALSGTAMAVKKIGPSGLKKNAVTTKKIADSAVTTPKIANGAVSTQKLGDSAVTESKLAQDSVSGSKIQQAVIGTGKLRDAAVETDKIADLAVTTPKIGDSAVTGPKVADGSLGLLDVAAVVHEALPDPPNIPTGQCDDAPNVSVSGIQAGDSLLVLPKPISPASQADLAPIAGQVDPATGDVNVVFCNGGAAVDPGPQRVTIAAFR
jgi:hypothetical protein